MNEREQPLRIATFNLKHGAQEEGYLTDTAQVIEACEQLKELEIDILALQEVDRGTVRAKFTDLASLAAKATGMKMEFSETLKYRVGRYGNALLVKGEFEGTTVTSLGSGPRFRKQMFDREWRYGYEPRNAIIATVTVRDRRFTVAGTHLSTNKSDSPVQLSILARVLERLPEPQILAGDLNLSRERVTEVARLETFDFVENAPTYPASDPSRMIDHIAVRGLSIISARSVKLPISDHRALIADIV